MTSKKIKLSAKKGGRGYISSYTVNISKNEAIECGFVDAEIVKVIDPEHKTITIKLAD